MTSHAVHEYFERQSETYLSRQTAWPWHLLRRLEEEAIRRLAESLQFRIALDLGCGSGYYSTRLLTWGAERVVAVDGSEGMVRSIDAAGIHAVVGMAESISLGESFDLVLSAGLLEFSQAPEAVLANAHRHANPGAHLLLLVPTPSLFATIYRWFHRRHGFLIRLFDKDMLSEMLTRTGWHLEACVSVAPFSLAARAARI